MAGYGFLRLTPWKSARCRARYRAIGRLLSYSGPRLAVLVIEEDGGTRRQGTVVQGDVPSPADPPPGCRFHPRCPKAQSRCGKEEPLLEAKLRDRADHVAACHYPVEAGEELGRTASPDDRLS